MLFNQNNYNFNTAKTTKNYTAKNKITGKRT